MPSTVAELADPAISGPNADPDGDGFTNLLECALGLDPRSATTERVPQLSLGASEWVYRYARPDIVTDVTYDVEISPDLSTWTTSGVTQYAGTSTGGTTTWEARAAAPAGGTLFFRLKV